MIRPLTGWDLGRFLGDKKKKKKRSISSNKFSCVSAKTFYIPRLDEDTLSVETVAGIVIDIKNE